MIISRRRTVVLVLGSHAIHSTHKRTLRFWTRLYKALLINGQFIDLYHLVTNWVNIHHVFRQRTVMLLGYRRSIIGESRFIPVAPSTGSRFVLPDSAVFVLALCAGYCVSALILKGQVRRSIAVFCYSRSSSGLLTQDP
jgi:hypothetical protein